MVGIEGSASARPMPAAVSAPPGADDAALPEPVDDAVAGEPAERHGRRQRDEAEAGGGRARRQLVAQVEGAPRAAGVLDERAAHREHAERRHA